MSAQRTPDRTPGISHSAPPRRIVRLPAPTLARSLAAAYTLLTVYACLHPLSEWRDTGLPVFDYLVAPWPKYFLASDLVFNVLGYLPFGFIAVAALPRRWPTGRMVLAAALAGGLVSFSLETVQNFLPSRVASNIDLGANVAGSLLGALAGARWGHALFDRNGILQRWRAARIVRGRAGDIGLILLGLWLLGQLTPEDLLFGSGDVRSLLGVAAPLPFSPERFIVLEAVLGAATVLAVGLLARCMMWSPGPWPILLLLVCGIGAKALATGIFFVPGAPLAWLTPGAARGLAAGVALLLASLALPRVLQHAVAGMALLAATALANLLPENPYLPYSQELVRQGNFASFHGLTTLVDSFWPFAALGYLSALGLWRGEHLGGEPRL